jgi:septum formation protein
MRLQHWGNSQRLLLDPAKPCCRALCATALLIQSVSGFVGGTTTTIPAAASGILPLIGTSSRDLHQKCAGWHSPFPVHDSISHYWRTIMSSSEGTTEAEKDARHFVLSYTDHLVGPQGGDIALILASQSPRRREILDMMGLKDKFTATPSPLDESALQVRLAKENPVHYTRKLAEEKAKALGVAISSTVTKPTLVLGSDTIVDLDGKILEKPKDESEAKQMLSSLSERTHSVHTGVAFYHVSTSSNNGAPILITSFTDTAQVSFAKLSEADIDAYIATGEPMDKAGSYGIQGIGGQIVSNVVGDFFTVMGLPMHRTSKALAQAIARIINP